MKIIVYSLCLLFISCSGPSGRKNIAGTETIKYFDDAHVDPSWSKENTLVYHLISEPDNLHPSNGNSNPRSEILQYVHRCLLYIDFKNNSIAPGLVESLPVISADSLTYSYKIRKNITWDDGHPLTVSDIIFTAKAFKCPLTNDPSVRFYWNNVKDILPGEDERSFNIVMYQKNFQNISFLTAFPVLECSFHDSSDVLKNFTLAQFGDSTFHAAEYPPLVRWAASFNDDANGRLPAKINGLGMYKVAEWKSGQYISLIKKTGHWSEHSENYLDHAYPDKIIFLVNKDETSQLLDFRNQRMDVSTTCTVNTILELTKDKQFNANYNAAMLPTFNYTFIAMNEKPVTRPSLFTDVKVRRALALLTPVNEIAKIVYLDYSKDCKRMISNVSPLKREFNSNLEPIPYDVRQAEKLLSEAGWKDSDGDGILDKEVDGKKIILKADLNYLSVIPEWKSIAVFLAEQYGKAGIAVNPVGMEIKQLIEKAKNHDFDLMLGGWSGSSFAEDYTQLWHTSSWKSNGSNYTGFGTEESDKLIESMKTELNDSLRAIKSARLQKMIYDDQPYVFLYSSLRRYIIHKRFGNQMIFAERPGVLCNNLRLLTTDGISVKSQVAP